MSPWSWPRGSLYPLTLTQIPLRLHPLCSTAAAPAPPLSPPSMTHQSLPHSSHSLNHVFYLGVFAIVDACARPARVRCAGRPGTDCCPPGFRLVKRSGGLARGGCPRGCRHQLRFHSRNVCQRSLQDHAAAAVWPPLHCIHKQIERGHKTWIAHLVAPLLLTYYRSELCAGFLGAECGQSGQK